VLGVRGRRMSAGGLREKGSALQALPRCVCVSHLKGPAAREGCHLSGVSFSRHFSCFDQHPAFLPQLLPPAAPRPSYPLLPRVISVL